MFNKQHANDLVVVSAKMDEKDASTVIAFATPGGARVSPAWEEGRAFRVPVTEYVGRGTFGFVINPEVHTPAEWR